jgi:hypothetical protein
MCKHTGFEEKVSPEEWRSPEDEKPLIAIAESLLRELQALLEAGEEVFRLCSGVVMQVFYVLSFDYETYREAEGHRLIRGNTSIGRDKASVALIKKIQCQYQTRIHMSF